MTIPAGTASFLVASAPVFVALLARLFLRERLLPWGWAGIGTSFAGVAVIALGTGAGLRIDARALVVLAATASVVYLALVPGALGYLAGVTFWLGYRPPWRGASHT